MSATVDPPQLADIAADVQAGRRTAAEILESYAERADEHKELNAIVSPQWNQAREQAEQIDGLSKAELSQLPLAGIPLTVKDIICVEGSPTSAGGAAWADDVAAADASSVAFLRAAGGLIVGKTNLPEMALGMVTENQRFGRTSNPIDADRTPGGSSGGEAAAIAAGISAAGIGTDYGGSVRWPAQCTGICAIRPTPGRIPATGQVPGAGGNIGVSRPPLPLLASQQGLLQVIGPMARYVEDLRLLLQVMAKPDGVDPRVSPLKVPSLAAISDLRIGWTTGSAIARVRPEMAAAVESVAEALSEECADVVEFPEALAQCLNAYNTIRSMEPATDHFLALEGRIDQVPDAVRSRLISPPGPDPDALVRAWAEGVEVRRRALELFREVDVLILPVAGGPAADHDGGVDIDGVRVEGDTLMSHCRAVTLLGAPVVSLPIARSVEGLPLSVQVVAAPWREHLALDVANRLESIVGIYRPLVTNIAAVKLPPLQGH